MKSKDPNCAACAHQRRRCKPDCILRPYFPREQSTEFEQAQRIFGTRNIEKILLQQVDPNLREQVADSIKYESNLLSTSPGYGCLQVVRDLKTQLNLQYAQLLHCQNQLAQLKSAIAASSQFPTPLQNHNYFQDDFFSGGGQYGNYPYKTTNHAQQQALDSCFRGWHSTHAQQQLPNSNNLPPLANNNYHNATASLPAQQPSPLRVLYPKETADVSATRDFFPVGGHDGNFAYGDRENGTISHGQQLVPNSNNLPSVTQNFDEEEDLYSFAYGVKETGKESAKYMPKDGNPFL